MNDKIVLGLSGKIASGKDTFADYIVEKYGGVSVSFSKPLRDILNIAYLPIERSNLSWLAQTLVDKFGGDVISNIIGREIKKSDKKIFVLPNIRRGDDAIYFKDWPGYLSVGIDTKPEICYERLVKRGQNLDDNTKTWEQFQKDLLLSTEIEIDKLVESAKFKIDNNGTLEDLHKQIDEIMEKLLKNKPE